MPGDDVIPGIDASAPVELSQTHEPVATAGGPPAAPTPPRALDPRRVALEHLYATRKANELAIRALESSIRGDAAAAAGGKPGACAHLETIPCNTLTGKRAMCRECGVMVYDSAPIAPTNERA